MQRPNCSHPAIAINTTRGFMAYKLSTSAYFGVLKIPPYAGGITFKLGKPY